MTSTMPLMRGIAPPFRTRRSNASFDGRVLVDGGIMNPVPVDVLPREVDLVVAVDVVSFPEPADGRSIPGAMEAIFGSTQLLMQQIAAAMPALPDPPEPQPWPAAAKPSALGLDRAGPRHPRS